jgi:SOS-response transcriptional repressor LexA
MFSISDSSKHKVLTKRQSAVYNYLVSYVEEQKIAPTYEEITQDCELGSITNAYRIVRDLIGKKLVHKIGRKSQSRQAYPILDKKYIKSGD